MIEVGETDGGVIRGPFVVGFGDEVVRGFEAVFEVLRDGRAGYSLGYDMPVWLEKVLNGVSCLPMGARSVTIPRESSS